MEAQSQVVKLKTAVGFVRAEVIIIPVIEYMNCDTAGRRVARTTLIPLLLIVIGIFVWGVRYKLSLYDSPSSPPDQ